MTRDGEITGELCTVDTDFPIECCIILDREVFKTIPEELLCNAIFITGGGDC